VRELVYYVAVSLDGYIAGPGGEFDAFPVEGDHMAAQNERFADAIPTVIADAMGIERTGTMFDSVVSGLEHVRRRTAGRHDKPVPTPPPGGVLTDKIRG
jgi:hypothetical protein